MRRSVLMLSFALFSLSNLATAENEEVKDLLKNTIDALEKGLQYMEKHASEINFDGAFGCRLVEVLLRSFLRSNIGIFDQLDMVIFEKIEMLAWRADKVVEKSKVYLKMNDAYYYNDFGGLLDRNDATIGYPSRVTNPLLMVHPLPCEKSVFNGTFSDHCLREIIKGRGYTPTSCILSRRCLDFMTEPKKRGYALTHQVLYFLLIEMKCLKKSFLKVTPQILRDTLCSNVMRDSLEISFSGYPLYHRDLFMEQIGFCGLWGYKDFYNEDWQREILDWQQRSGCYANHAKYICMENLPRHNIRIKREEKLLKDGCLSHKTTVALLALAANIRFSIEKIFETMHKKDFS